MSATGQKRRFDNRPVTSGLPPINGHRQTGRLVRFVPIGDIARLAQRAFGFVERDHRATGARLTMQGTSLDIPVFRT